MTFDAFVYDDPYFDARELTPIYLFDLDSVFDSDAFDYSNMSYFEYLQSAHWQKVRRVCLERTEHKCERCGSKEKLQVHHLTYERLGRERVSDLEVLCDSCHNEEHSLSEDNQKAVIKSANDRPRKTGYSIYDYLLAPAPKVEP